MDTGSSVECSETRLLVPEAASDQEITNINLNESKDGRVIETYVKSETQNTFFNDLFEKELDLKNKFSDVETQDIHEAVNRQLNFIAQRIGEQDERLRIKEVIPVGSAREGTQIIRPCEYDYILTLENLSESGAVSIRPINPSVSRREYVYVKLEDNDTRSRFHEILTANDEIRSRYCFNLENSSEQYRLRSLMCDGRGLRGIFCAPKGLRDVFFSAIHESVILSSGSAVHMNTGTLIVIVSKPEEHGPAFTIRFLWKRGTIENQPTMAISVDVVPVLKIPWEMYNNLLTEVEGFVVNYFDHVESVGSLLLMPREGLNFHVNFTEAELYHMKNLSHHHKKCYKLLKYMLNGEPFPLESNTNWLMKYFKHTDTLFHSYSLKLVVWEHHYLQQCTEDNDLSLCIPKILSKLRGALTEGLIHPFYRNRPIVPPVSIFENNKKRFLCRKRLKTLNHVLTILQTTPMEDYSYDTFCRAISHHQMWKSITAKTVCRIVLVLSFVISFYACILVALSNSDKSFAHYMPIGLGVLFLLFCLGCCIKGQ